ncbi:MAG: peptidylprolyl isomerase [Planctomycetota bacterium]|nr:peptidylprolyl isomerase [Planctomycetota bacterium]
MLALLALVGSLLVAPQHLGVERPPLASVRRIVLTHAAIPGSTNARTAEQARDLARDLGARIRAGMDFGRLAAEYSSSPDARNGGELGTFVPGVLAPALDAFLFTAREGDVSEPLELPTGWCVLQRVPTNAAVLRIQVTGEGERREQKVREVERRLRAGDDFALVARELSDDATSAARGGQYAIFERGASDTLLKRMAFDAPIGAILGPVDLPPFGSNWIRRVPLEAVDPILREDQFVRLSAILFPFDTAIGADPLKTPNEVAAKNVADSVLKALDAGSDFAKLAREHTGDPGGREVGGDLGWIHRATPNLPDAVRNAFLLAPGDHTVVQRAPAGWVILKRDA